MLFKNVANLVANEINDMYCYIVVPYYYSLKQWLYLGIQR